MMPRRLMLVARCAALCLGACGPALESGALEQGSNAIINGAPSSEPWSVALARADGAVTCSGTLVSPWHVVTAAHCVSPFFGAQPPDFVFVCDDARGATPATRPGCYVEVASAVSHPAYQLATGSADVAVVTLRVPRAGPYLRLPSGPLGASVVGATVRTIGFGADQVTVFADGGVATDGGGLKREGHETVQFVGPMPFGSTFPNVLGLAADTLQTSRSPSAVCFGDSGGSVLLPATGPQATLVGLPSIGLKGCDGYVVHLMVGAQLCWLAAQGVPTACSDGGFDWDAGVDQPPDAGAEPRDAGAAPPDAGGEAPDAGAPETDPGPAPDAGAPARPSKEDTVVDLGTTKLRPGCGCSASAGPGVALLLGARRPRRRALRRAPEWASP